VIDCTCWLGDSMTARLHAERHTCPVHGDQTLRPSYQSPDRAEGAVMSTKREVVDPWADVPRLRLTSIDAECRVCNCRESDGTVSEEADDNGPYVRWADVRDALATVRALQQRNQELQTRMAALDPNHPVGGVQVPNPTTCGEQAVER
jgi:hypothetical protein